MRLHTLTSRLVACVAACCLAGGLLVATSSAAPAAAVPDVAPATSASSAAVSAVAPAAARPPRKNRKRNGNPITPGNFTGYGFDQCLAPTQTTMNTWLAHSPFLAVGIYISGDSRACREQPNLTPQWIRIQLQRGWRLLPITLGPQASCQPRFPRYQDDFTISPKPGYGRYSTARGMGRDSAASTVADALALGIAPGSTLWYDLEGFDITNTHCRESALSFLSAWTTDVRELGFVPGVYSSAGSGIKAIDDARVNRPGKFDLPDRIWLARWDGVANTSSSYLREDGWRPGGRVKQYRGGHDETWGGARINIDSNYLDLGKGSVAPAENNCSGTMLSFPAYGTIEPPRAGYTPDADRVKALKCRLRQEGYYEGPVDATYGPAAITAARKWKVDRGYPADDRWFRRDWVSILSWGERRVLKIGSAGRPVRRVQRGINAADIGTKVVATGTFNNATAIAVRAYQKRVGLPQTGIVTDAVWQQLHRGNR